LDRDKIADGGYEALATASASSVSVSARAGSYPIEANSLRPSVSGASAPGLAQGEQAPSLAEQRVGALGHGDHTQAATLHAEAAERWRDFGNAVVAPLVSLLMTALTLAAAFGSLVLIFQDGRLEGLLDYGGQNALDLTIPLVLAALVFAIATDYGVFLLSRIREARLGGLTDREAIQASVATVSRIVVSAAVLFAVSIGVFGTSSIVVLKILGIGTAAAVLVDSLFVRSMLLPASLALLGPRAWWAPTPLRRLHEWIGLREEHSVDAQTGPPARSPVELQDS